MTTLEERFVDAVDRLELPEVDLAPAVLAEIVGGGPRQVDWTRRLAVAAAVALLAGVAATLAIEPAREAVADWLGIGATEVEVDPDGTDPSGLPPSATLDLGEPASVDLDPLPPLGPPDTASDLATARGRRFSWPAGPDLPPLAGTQVGAVLSVRTIDGAVDAKALLSDELIESVVVVVDGTEASGLWIGAEHEYLSADAVGPALAQQVLIWLADGVQFRLEADLPLVEMIRLAEAVSGGTDLLQPG